MNGSRADTISAEMPNISGRNNEIIHAWRRKTSNKNSLREPNRYRQHALGTEATISIPSPLRKCKSLPKDKSEVAQESTDWRLLWGGEFFSIMSVNVFLKQAT